MDLDKMPYTPGRPELYVERPGEAEVHEEHAERRLYKALRSLRIVKERSRSTSSPVVKKLIRDMQSTELTPLQTIGSKVVGSLFDRVRFLRGRIAETEVAIREREAMNKAFNAEINADIEELQRLLPGVSDKDEFRDLKLNISLLRMEKRKENMTHWRDIVTLRTRLRELKEQLETETKISELFSDLEKNFDVESRSEGE